MCRERDRPRDPAHDGARRMERLMSNTDPKSSTTPASLPEQAGRLALFGPAPLFEGEDAAAYDELLARISGAVKPADIFEEIWVRDIVDLVWEVLRLRWLKANLMTATAYRGLQQILKPLVGFLEEEKLAKAWAARDQSAIKRVDKLLASAGLTMDAVMAQTLSISLDDIERIDRMIATAEMRRNAILHEVDRHRTTWGEELRRAAQQAEDAEFKAHRGPIGQNENCSVSTAGKISAN